VRRGFVNCVCGSFEPLEPAPQREISEGRKSPSAIVGVGAFSPDFGTDVKGGTLTLGSIISITSYVIDVSSFGVPLDAVRELVVFINAERYAVRPFH